MWKIICKKCFGSGWVYCDELDDPCENVDNPSFFNMCRHTCDWCNGRKWVR